MDNRVVAFTRQGTRPAADAFIDFVRIMDATIADWNSTISALVPNDGTVVPDCSDQQNACTLPISGAQLTAFMNALISMQSNINANASTLRNLFGRMRTHGQN